MKNDKNKKFSDKYLALMPELIRFTENKLDKNKDDAEDLVMRVYETLFKRSKEDNFPDHLYNYAKRCLKNLAIDDSRLLKNKNTVGEQAAFGMDKNNDPLGVDSIADPLSEIVYSSGNIKKDMAQTVEEALEGLSEDCKDILRRHGTGHSYAEISNILGIPTLTVGSRMARCREHLNSIKDMYDYV